MNTIRRTFLFVTIGGAILFLYSATHGGPSGWEPVHFPFPGNGFEIKSGFHVYETGTYRLEATIPVAIPNSELGLPQLPPIDCALRVRLAGPSVSESDLQISSLDHGARYYWGLVDYYSSRKEWELKPGDYQIEVSSEKPCEMAASRGAMLSLTQFKRPVEYMLSGAVRFWTSVGVCFIGLAGLLFCEFKGKPR